MPPKGVEGRQTLEELQAEWTDLFKHRLPQRAKDRKAKGQEPKWPVALDHCFARIILDNAVGRDTPWMNKVKAPATKNMSAEQLQAALKLGYKVEKDEVDLGELDQKSLNLRGKKGPKAKQAAARASKGVNHGQEVVKKETPPDTTAKPALRSARKRPRRDESSPASKRIKKSGPAEKE